VAPKAPALRPFNREQLCNAVAPPRTRSCPLVDRTVSQAIVFCFLTRKMPTPSSSLHQFSQRARCFASRCFVSLSVFNCQAITMEWLVERKSTKNISEHTPNTKGMMAPLWEVSFFSYIWDATSWFRFGSVSWVVSWGKFSTQFIVFNSTWLIRGWSQRQELRKKEEKEGQFFSLEYLTIEPQWPIFGDVER